MCAERRNDGCRWLASGARDCHTPDLLVGLFTYGACKLMFSAIRGMTKDDEKVAEGPQLNKEQKDKVMLISELAGMAPDEVISEALIKYEQNLFLNELKAEPETGMGRGEKKNAERMRE